MELGGNGTHSGVSVSLPYGSVQLKILQISSAQAFGGGERHLVDLSNELTRRRHEVFAIVRPRSPLVPRLTELSPEHIQTLPLRNALDVSSANQLAAFVKRHKIEIVHAHMARDYSLAAFATRRNPGTRLIVTRHVLFRLNRLHSRVLSRASRVIAVSEAVARELRKQNLLSASKISVVRNGVDVDALSTVRDSIQRQQQFVKYGFPSDALVAGTVGQLSPLKGHDVFIQAAATVAENLPNARFVIAGSDVSRDGETVVALTRLTRELGVENHFRFVGAVDDVSSVLSVLDLFVSASRSEAFGLAMVEAMACSVPIVATDTEGAREVVEEQETGLLVPVGDHEALAASITRLLSDSKLRARMGQLALDRAREQFSLQRMVDEVEAIYRGDV